MDIRIAKGKFNRASVEAISSKSYVHRDLIAGGLSKDKISVVTNIKSEDMHATAGCLVAMGAEIQDIKSGFSIIRNVSPGDKITLDCKESGSTARFIMPVAAQLYNDVYMSGSGRLPSRPFAELCNALRAHGLSVSSDFLPVNISGQLKPGCFKLPGNVSSQYISGLLFALPVNEYGDSVIELTSPLESENYVRMTISVLADFGIGIKREENRFFINGGQKYSLDIKPDEEGFKRIEAEGDWSNGSYVLSMGAAGGSIEALNLDLTSLQGDRAYIDCIKRMGAGVSVTEDLPLSDGVKQGKRIAVSHKELKGAVIDGKNIPDLIPALAVVAAFADGESTFCNVKRLRIKESDRIKEILKVLEAMGASGEAVLKNDDIDLIVKPVSRVPDEIVIDGANDHRIVMAGAIAAAGAGRPVIIKGAEAVRKSYPGFFDMCRDELKMSVEVL